MAIVDEQQNNNRVFLCWGGDCLQRMVPSESNQLWPLKFRTHGSFWILTLLYLYIHIYIYISPLSAVFNVFRPGCIHCLECTLVGLHCPQCTTKVNVQGTNRSYQRKSANEWTINADTGGPGCVLVFRVPVRVQHRVIGLLFCQRY